MIRLMKLGSLEAIQEDMFEVEVTCFCDTVLVVYNSCTG